MADVAERSTPRSRRLAIAGLAKLAELVRLRTADEVPATPCAGAATKKAQPVSLVADLLHRRWVPAAADDKGISGCQGSVANYVFARYT